MVYSNASQRRLGEGSVSEQSFRNRSEKRQWSWKQPVCISKGVEQSRNGLLLRKPFWFRPTGFLTTFVVTACFLAAQQPPSTPRLTIAQTVEASLRNYPSIQVSQERISAAAAGIQLARTAYIPRVDTLAQVNRATRNNVFGLLLPQSVIPSISGPVLGTNTFGTAWGSAVGVLVTWEPFDFGLRQANVNAAAAARTQSEATLNRSQFDVSVAAADAYLTLIAAEETVRAAQAGVDRAEVISRTITALVSSQLRPGADASRAQAELAAARTQLIQAQQAVEVGRATVSQFVGLPPDQITVSAPKLLELPPERVASPVDTTANPIAVEQSALIDQLKTQLRILERTYFPRFFAQGSAYARGTGAQVNGNNLGGLNGLAPTIFNGALGFTVTFPILDRPSIRARESAQAATIRAETARLRQIATDLTAQWNRAVASLGGAFNVAANTPVQVAAARAATEQATARYRSGLGNIDEVAEAQRLLTQSEIDDALARLSVWRGLLSVASAAGDIQPFVTEASQ
jgi:outer membrane protein TolC